MSLFPTPTELIARARTDLRLGLPVVLRSDGATAFVLAAEGITEDRLASAREIGQPVLAITSRRAETLRARAYDGDVARIRLPLDADAAWIANVADPQSDLDAPMKGPFATEREGSAALHRVAIRLVKSAHLLPAALVFMGEAADLKDLTVLHANTTEKALNQPAVHNQIVQGRVPLSVSEAGRVHVFRPADGGEEHVVCEIGQPDRSKPVLARLHSACFTGDVLGSLKCDCGSQLKAALQAMGREGEGVLLYLNQEGRGIGLANKMRAYSLQDQGFDTVEANHRLGFEDDERDFRTGADLLKRLGFSSVRLMTNNPAKVRMMEAQGIEVSERVPLKVGLNPLNEKYLDVKAKKSGHIL
ncbi:MAG: GTP cyclohydrolase II [Paracoccaceae bacterium]|nr:GTP cyclohydrolase II [Paracoccaceae bacterium]